MNRGARMVKDTDWDLGKAQASRQQNSAVLLGVRRLSKEYSGLRGKTLADSRTNCIYCHKGAAEGQGRRAGWQDEQHRQ